MVAKRKPARKTTARATRKATTGTASARKPKATSAPKTKISPAPIRVTGSTVIETGAGSIHLGPVLPGALPFGAVRGATSETALRALIDALVADGAEAMRYILDVVGEDGEESAIVRGAFEEHFLDAPPGFFGAVMRCMTTAGQIGSGGGRTWPASRTVPDVMLWANNAPAPVRVYPGSWGASVAAFARYAPGGEVLPWTSMPKEVRDALHHAVERGWAVSDVCPVRGPKYRGIRLAPALRL